MSYVTERGESGGMGSCGMCYQLVIAYLLPVRQLAGQPRLLLVTRKLRDTLLHPLNDTEVLSNKQYQFEGRPDLLLSLWRICGP